MAQLCLIREGTNISKHFHEEKSNYFINIPKIKHVQNFTFKTNVCMFTNAHSLFAIPWFSLTVATRRLLSLLDVVFRDYLTLLLLPLFKVAAPQRVPGKST